MSELNAARAILGRNYDVEDVDGQGNAVRVDVRANWQRLCAWGGGLWHGHDAPNGAGVFSGRSGYCFVSDGIGAERKGTLEAAPGDNIAALHASASVAQLINLSLCGAD